jgi:hypothetical protein
MRLLAKCGAFTVPAIAGPALAIGAATAVFSGFSAMLLRSMGFDDARRIVAVWATDEPHPQKHLEVCFDDMLAWRSAGAVEDVALASPVNLDFAITAATACGRRDSGPIPDSSGGRFGSAPARRPSSASPGGSLI